MACRRSVFGAHPLLLAASLGVLVGCRLGAHDAGQDASPARPAAIADEPLTLEGWPFVTEEARRRQLEAAEQLGLTVSKEIDLGSGATMTFVLIPAGDFIMGSPRSEADRSVVEGPRHCVRITKPFYVAKTEVTRMQYVVVRRTDHSMSGGIDLPMDRVSWFDATEFCREFTRLTGTDVRLPTEAEWEYACRAGTATAFHFGESLDPSQASFQPDPWAPALLAKPVGSYPANAWGLHDMHGSVWEWCADRWWYYRTAETDGQPWEDPTGPKEPPGVRCHVVRGGSRRNLAHNCRSANRCAYGPHMRSFGFRVVAPIPPGR